MMRWRLILTFLLGLVPMASSAASANATCMPGEIVTIDHVGERGELTLGDGRIVRLAGLDLGVSPPGEHDWTSFLTRLTRDAAIRLGNTGEKDRWGRIGAQVYVKPQEAGTEAWLQGFLLEIGAARLLPEPEVKSCWVELRAEEDRGRLGKAGVWAEQGAILEPSAPEAILKKRGQLAMVEGKIIGLGESRAVFYLNFGRSWRNDFSVLILKRQAKLFDSAGLKPADLVRKRVRVRGIVDGLQGPRIEVSLPEQIEVLDLN